VRLPAAASTDRTHRWRRTRRKVLIMVRRSGSSVWAMDWSTLLDYFRPLNLERSMLKRILVLMGETPSSASAREYAFRLAQNTQSDVTGLAGTDLTYIEAPILGGDRHHLIQDPA
jgi:hypothetical protein